MKLGQLNTSVINLLKSLKTAVKFGKVKGKVEIEDLAAEGLRVGQDSGSRASVAHVILIPPFRFLHACKIFNQCDIRRED